MSRSAVRLESVSGRDYQFDVMSIAIGRYRYHGEIAGMGVEVAELVSALGELGGECRLTAPSTLDMSSINELMAQWAADRQPRSSIIVWQGHGEARGNEAWLATEETQRPMRGTGMSPSVFAEHLINDWRRRAHDDTAWTLVVVEACGAANFVRLLAGVLLQADPASSPQRLALVGVGGDGTNYLGEFRRALAAALASYTDNDREIAIKDLVDRVESRIDAVQVQPFRLSRSAAILHRRVFPGVVAAPLDVYDELRRCLDEMTSDERNHFVHKAQGAEHGELAWYFTGRRDELRRIADWLDRTRSGLLIITGRAGSGKSALLGNVLVHTNTELCRVLKRAGQFDPLTTSDGRAERQLAPFDAVIHLAGLTTQDLIHRIAEANDVDLTDGRKSEGKSDMDVLLEVLRGRPFLLLVDGLDEAQEPAAVASSVLRRLAALPNGRVVVGTRASVHEGPDQPDTAAEDLLDALGRAANTKRLVVDRDAETIAEYVRRRIRAAVDDGRLPIELESVAWVSKLIAGQDRQFLYARLAVHEILAQPDLLDPHHHHDLRELLSRDHRALFATAVDRLSALAPANYPLLEALALARGRGLPRADRLWVTVASALAESGPVTETDIDRLIAAARPYILLDAEDGQSVYRLAHQCFREYFEARAETQGE
jgi:hypothetical protein